MFMYKIISQTFGMYKIISHTFGVVSDSVAVPYRGIFLAWRNKVDVSLYILTVQKMRRQMNA